jgi:hypothetical protein
MIDYIRIKDWPPDYAQTAYRDGHFIEALQVLHGWIELRLRGILLLQRAKPDSESDHSTFGRAWDISNELSLSNIAKALFVAGVLPSETFDKIITFNRTRNAVIHKLFLEPHEKQYLGVPRPEYDAAFHRGLELCDVLETMGDELV